jgi:hypothetical protein
LIEDRFIDTKCKLPLPSFVLPIGAAALVPGHPKGAIAPLRSARAVAVHGSKAVHRRTAG